MVNEIISIHQPLPQPKSQHVPCSLEAAPPFSHGQQEVANIPRVPTRFRIRPVCAGHSAQMMGLWCCIWGRRAQSSGFEPDCLGSKPGSAYTRSVALDKLPNLFVPQFLFVKWGEYTKGCPASHLVYPCPSILSGAQVSQRQPQLARLRSLLLPATLSPGVGRHGSAIGGLHLTGT